MSWLSKVEQNKPKSSLFVITYGPNGVGKTYSAAKLGKNVLFTGPEQGNAFLPFKVSNLPAPESFQQQLQMLDEIIAAQHNFDTLVFDSLDHFEPMIWEHTCKVLSRGDKKYSSIEDFGFAKGYIYCLAYWNEFFTRMKKLSEKMNVVMIAHAKIKAFQDPTLTQGYDRYEIKLHDKAAALAKELVDAVLFCTYDTVVTTGDAKAKAFGTDRVMFTGYRPGAEAKNRYGLPEKMPLDLSLIQKHIEAGSTTQTIEEMQSTIASLLTRIDNEKLKDTVKEHLNKIGNDAAGLARLIQKLETQI